VDFFGRSFERGGECPVSIELLAPINDAPLGLAPETKIERVEQEEIVDGARRAIVKMKIVIPRRRLDALLCQSIRRARDGFGFDADGARVFDDVRGGLEYAARSTASWLMRTQRARATTKPSSSTHFQRIRTRQPGFCLFGSLVRLAHWHIGRHLQRLPASVRKRSPASSHVIVERPSFTRI
jgi:hypothetical protein